MAGLKESICRNGFELFREGCRPGKLYSPGGNAEIENLNSGACYSRLTSFSISGIWVSYFFIILLHII